MNRRGFIQSVLAGLAAVFAWRPGQTKAGVDAYRTGGAARDIPELPKSAIPVARRPGMELVFDPMAQAGDPGPVVAMTMFQDSVMVATPRAIYRIQRDVQDGFEVSPVEFQP